MKEKTDLPDDQKVTVLLQVYQGQRDESLAKRQTIFNIFSLAMAGLITLVAGILAIGRMDIGSKVVVGFAVAIVLGSLICFIRDRCFTKK